MVPECLPLHKFNLAFVGSRFEHREAFCLSRSVQVLPLNMTTPRDSYPWNYRELVTVLTLSECLAKGGFGPLTLGSMTKAPITELPCHPTYLLVDKDGAQTRKVLKNSRKIAPMKTGA